MTQYRLKQTDEARSALAKGIEIANTHLPRFGSRNLGADWKDVIIAHVLLHEAQELIEKKGKN
jgi:hypothetical protein